MAGNLWNLAAVAAVIVALPAAAAEKYALVVGVDRYRETELSSLDFPDDDAIRLGEALRGLGFDVVTMTSSAEQVSLQPDSPSDIVESLDRRLKFRDRDDVVVVSLSGHGVQFVGDAPRPDGTRETWFCPAKAKLDDRGSLLPISLVIERMKACPAARKLLLVDACRNDMAPPGTKFPDVIVRELDPAAPARRLIPDGMVALFSCSAREKSFERKEIGHSLFSYHVIEYLAGRADDPGRFYDNGEATLADLVAYAQKRTARAAEGLGANQTPELVGRMTNWSFGRVGGESASAARRPVVPPAGGVIENSIGMKLVEIPAGTFEMGSEDTKERLKASGFGFFDYEQFDNSDERPVHDVQITTPFLMGVHEVTVGEFRSFYDDGYQGKLDCEKDGKGGYGYNARNKDDPFTQRPDHLPWNWGHPDMNASTEEGRRKAFRYPVVNVSWNDAVAFCEWLSRKERRKYRLPTEAEWEYACRAGTRSRFWNGDDPEGLAGIANVADATAKEKLPSLKVTSKARDGHAFTAPVGSFQSSPFGLHDMHGNVNEWCNDWYDETYYAQQSGQNPRGPALAGGDRVIRGGSWSLEPLSCRSAFRGNVAATYRNRNVGFRVVCELR